MTELTVLFCGVGRFESAYIFTKRYLSNCSYCKVIEASDGEISVLLHTVDVIIPLMTKISREMIAASPKLKMIMQFGVGLEGVDIEAATQNNVWVCNIPSEGSGNAQACAEHAIYLALAVLRDQHGMKESILTGKLGLPTGRTLFGSTVCIYGYGGIGRQLHDRLKAFTKDIIIVKRNKNESKSEIAYENAITMRQQDPAIPVSISNQESFPLSENHGEELWVSPDDFLAGPSGCIDILFLCCSQNKDNIGFVNRDFINKLKTGCIIVNVARGGLINYSDLLEALHSSQVGGVGMDVFHTEPFPIMNDCDREFIFHPKVVATPHVAGVTQISYMSMARSVADNVIRVHDGLNPIGHVNNI
eukprot:gene8169-11054_t